MVEGIAERVGQQQRIAGTKPNPGGPSSSSPREERRRRMVDISIRSIYRGTYIRNPHPRMAWPHREPTKHAQTSMLFVQPIGRRAKTHKQSLSFGGRGNFTRREATDRTAFVDCVASLRGSREASQGTSLPFTGDDTRGRSFFSRPSEATTIQMMWL